MNKANRIELPILSISGQEVLESYAHYIEFHNSYLKYKVNAITITKEGRNISNKILSYIDKNSINSIEVHDEIIDDDKNWNSLIISHNSADIVIVFESIKNALDIQKKLVEWRWSNNQI